MITCEGELYEASKLRISTDEVTFLDAENGERGVLSTSDVSEIILHSREYAAIKGFLFGAVVGGVGVITATSTDPVFKGHETINGGIGCGFFGAALGALVGDRDIFVLNDSVWRELKKYRSERKTYEVQLDGLLIETDYLVQAVWEGKSIWLPKRAVTIEEVDGVLRASVPRTLYEERLAGME